MILEKGDIFMQFQIPKSLHTQAVLRQVCTYIYVSLVSMQIHCVKFSQKINLAIGP